MRQLPIEVDPPEHSEYRKIVEPFFRRAKDPVVISRVETLIDSMLTNAFERESIEVVSEFALPIQSHALTYLLNVPEAEAETWIRWGVNVFNDGDSGLKPGVALNNYLRAQFDRAEADPGEDFFSSLTRADFRGQSLTREEMMGFGNLAFAGGRHTVIYSISSVLAHLAEHPETLEFLRQDPSRIIHAGEEFFRIISPVTHIGRVCPVDTDVHGVAVKSNGRVSLCWSSANQDETVFESPQELRVERKPNPHVAFGFGTHLCPGAAHARLIVRTLLRKCCERVGTLTVLEVRERVESEAAYQRVMGHEILKMRLTPR